MVGYIGFGLGVVALIAMYVYLLRKIDADAYDSNTSKTNIFLD